MKRNIFTLLLFVLVVSVGGCRIPAKQKTPMSYNDFKDFEGLPPEKARQKAKELAEANFQKGRLGYFTRFNLFIASDTEELPREEYLRKQYGIQTIIIKHCLIDGSILHAQDAYNETMESLFKNRFGKDIEDIMAEAIEYEKECYKKGPLKDDFGLYLSVLITRLVPENVTEVKVELSPNTFLQLKKKSENLWESSYLPHETPFLKYYVDKDKLIIGLKEKVEHYVGDHYFLSEKIRTEIENGNVIEITGEKTYQTVPVNVEMNKNSIILSSGKKTPIRVFWKNK